MVSALNDGRHRQACRPPDLMELWPIRRRDKAPNDRQLTAGLLSLFHHLDVGTPFARGVVQSARCGLPASGNLKDLRTARDAVAVRGHEGRAELGADRRPVRLVVTRGRRTDRAHARELRPAHRHVCWQACIPACFSARTLPAACPPGQGRRPVENEGEGGLRRLKIRIVRSGKAGAIQASSPATAREPAQSRRRRQSG